MTAGPISYESTEGMSEACRAGLRSLLLGCADTKLLLGYHYGEWTFGTPALEAAIANCSLAQTELGHVRLLHAVLRNHFGDDPDALIERRGADAFANVGYLDHPLPDWAGYVAANHVVDLAITRVVHAMRESTFKPLGMSVEKVLDEERYHAHHGQGWFRTLAARGGAERDAVAAAVNRALASVAEWLGPDDDAGDAALLEAGIKAEPNAALLEHLVTDLRAAAEPAGVDVAAPTLPRATDWHPATRRSRPGGPDAEMLEHLAGSRNAAFKL